MWNARTDGLVAKISVKPELIRVANWTKIDTFMGTVDLIISGLRIILTISGRFIFIVLGDVNLILITDA